MGHLQSVCKSARDGTKTTKAGKVTVKMMTVDNEVVTRKTASTEVVDDSDPIPMMENVKVESIVTGKNKKRMKKT